ncbi:unnamed protein product [Coccothraustes coccothraustes]
MLGAAAPAPQRLPALGAPVRRPPAGSGVLGRSCAPGLAPALFTLRRRVAGGEVAEYGGTGAQVVGVHRGRGCSWSRGEAAAALPVLHTLLAGGCAQSRPAAGTVVVLKRRNKNYIEKANGTGKIEEAIAIVVSDENGS